MDKHYQGIFSKEKIKFAEHIAKLRNQDYYRDGRNDMRCRISILFDNLSKEKRLDEFKVALKDPELLEKLFKEFNIRKYF